jgi:hypothetical protein
MKRFSKIALSVAAVSAVSAAMAMSAMAMTASYADGTVTLTDVSSTGASQTLLVLDTVDLQTVAAENIKQIDQDDTGVSFSSVTVGTLDDGTYEVRIGGDGTVQTTTFTVGNSGGDNTKTKEIIVGDINLDGEITGSDGVFLARYNADFTANIGSAGSEVTKADDNSAVIIGDVNLDDEITGSDGVFLARYNADFTTNIGSAGSQLTVIDE